MSTWRIDDISLNTDMGALADTVECIRNTLPGSKIILAVSPLVHDMKDLGRDSERAFPRVLSAWSDHRVFYSVELAGVPREVRAFEMSGSDISLASHGLVHVDHRLLGREAQELSILASCSLVETKMFVPPFNKYNADTLSICIEHGIELVQFENGWKHVRHNDYDPSWGLWYFHTHDTNCMDLAKWIGKGLGK